MIKNNSNVHISDLKEEQLTEVHNASLKVLENTGVLVEHEKAREIFSSIGCSVTEDNRVKFPGEIIEKAIQRAPADITIYSRDEKPQMELGDGNSYFGTVTSLPQMLNNDGSRHPYTVNDCRQMTIVMDALDTMDFATGTGMASDVPPELADIYEIVCMIENSPKPVLVTTFTEKGLLAVIDVCKIIRGSMDKFIKKPFIIYCTCPITPLRHSELTVSKMIMAVKNGFPYISVSAPGAGGTSPVSLVGTLVCGNAEMLSNLALAQTIRPGAPFIAGGFFTNMDMGSGVMLHGSPEFNLLNLAQAKLAKYYGLPSFSSAGCTDAHIIDEQAAFEAGFSYITAELGGASMVHAAGVLGSGSVVSKEMLVLSDELIQYIRHFSKGIKVNKEALAVEEIENVGPSGSFLDTDLTLKLFKTEHWKAKIFDRSFYDIWCQRGEISIKDKLNKKVNDILSNHIPKPLEEKKCKEINCLMKNYTDGYLI